MLIINSKNENFLLVSTLSFSGIRLINEFDFLYSLKRGYSLNYHNFVLKCVLRNKPCSLV